MVGLILLGIICGFLTGMGLGGGAIMVPALIYLWHLPQLTAQGIVMAVFLPTAVVASIIHIRHYPIRASFVAPLILGAFPAGFFGSYIAHHINGRWLAILFGLFLIFCALLQFIGVGKIYLKNKTEKSKRTR